MNAINIDIAKKLAEQGKNLFMNYMFIIILVALIIITVVYVIHKVRLDQANCHKLSKVYDSKPTLTSVSNTPNKKYLLRDFYIKSAYNCCCAGKFKNDYVNICALTTCIEQGARCLDFEIYSINDQPVVAASSIDDFTVKETFNFLDMDQVLTIINNLAFATTTPACADPLILHFRIMSSNKPMYDTLAAKIRKHLNQYTLDKTYSNEFSGKNLGTVSIADLVGKTGKTGKIIIAIDASNPIYRETALEEYVNIASGAPFLHLLKYQNVKFTQDIGLTDFNKKNMSIVIPSWNANDTNPNFNIARQYGCQFLAMSFQNYDSNLEHYNAFFDGQKSAFVLKPAKLRYVPITIPTPPPAPPKFSYATRPIKSDFYKYSI